MGITTSVGIGADSNKTLYAKYDTLISVYHPVESTKTPYSNRAKNINCYSTTPSEFSYELKFSYVQIQESGKLLYLISVYVGKYNASLKIDQNGGLFGKPVVNDDYLRVNYADRAIVRSYPRFIIYMNIGPPPFFREITQFQVWVELVTPSVGAIVTSKLFLASGSTLDFIAPSSPSALLSANKSDCPRLFGLSVTEVIYGGNLMQVLLRVENGGRVREYLRRPLLTRVVKGVGCTLNDKTAYLNSKSGLTNTDVTEGIIEYGMIRYFLWFLITKRWNIYILRRSRTKEFLATLGSSQYACWLPVVVNSEYVKYYIK